MPSKQADISFAQAMRSIRQCPWYWGNLTWIESELLLNHSQPGSYLIRDSASDRCIFTLSYRTEKSVHHTRLPQYGGLFCLGGPNSLVKAKTLRAFVEEAIKSCEKRGICMLMHTKGDRSATENVALIRPLQRHEFLPPLKYLCRLVIRHSANPTALSSLPLPPTMLNYIQDRRYILPPFVLELR